MWGAVVLLVVAVACFYGGMVYQQNATTAARTAAFSANGYTGLRAGRAGGAAAAGQIIAANPTSITIQMASGSTEIVLVSSGTTIMKSVAGSLNDLSVGTNVVVSGITNSDGSVTAQTLQIRPTGQTGATPTQSTSVTSGQ